MILCYMLPNGAASFTLCITYRSRSWRTRLFFPASRFSSLFLDALSRYLSLEIVFKGILFDPKEARNWFCFFFFCRHADIGKERRVGQFWLFATKVWTRIKMAHRIARASRKMPRSVCKEFDGARRGLLFLSLFYYFSFFFLFLWSFCAAWVCRRRLRWFLKDTCQRRWNVPPDGKTNVKRSHYRRPSFDIETFFFWEEEVLLRCRFVSSLLMATRQTFSCSIHADGCCSWTYRNLYVTICESQDLEMRVEGTVRFLRTGRNEFLFVFFYVV